MSNASRAARLRTAFHVFVAGVGISAVVFLVRSVGFETLRSILVAGLAWLPLLILLEGARIVLETHAHLLIFGAPGEAIAKAPFLRANLVSYTLANVLPLGRAAGEATKAAIVAPQVGFPCAAAAATSMQALSLVALAIVALPSLVFAILVGSSAWVTWGLVGHVAATLGAGLGIGWLGQRSGVRRLLQRLRTSPPSAQAYQDALRDQLSRPFAPLFALTCGRLLQAASIGVALLAAGLEPSLSGVWLAHGVHLIGTTLGDAIPAHLGTTDIAFAAAAADLGATQASAVVVALLAHFAQLAWVVVGALVPFVSFRASPSRPEPALTP